MRQKAGCTIIRGGQINAMGQREGLGLSWKALLYIIAIGARRNTIIAGEKQALVDRSPVGSEVTLVLPDLAGRAYAKVRNTHRAAPCGVSLQRGRLALCLEEPKAAVTPGQSVVLYDAEPPSVVALSPIFIQILSP